MIYLFDLPELAYQVAQYLDATDILACNAVSKSFHKMFTPLVWKDLHFGQPCKLDSDLTPLARHISLKHDISEEQWNQLDYHILQRINRWVRCLSILDHDSTLPLKLGALCNQLESISITGISNNNSENVDNVHNNKHTPEQLKLCKAIFQRNQANLKHICLINWKFNHRMKTAPGQSLWNPIVKCGHARNLRSLKMQDCMIRGRHMKAFWMVCERLEKLELSYVTIDICMPATTLKNQGFNKEGTSPVMTTLAYPSPVRPARFPVLKELILNSLRWASPNLQLNLIICQCPRLRTLNWDIKGRNFSGTEFVDRFEASTWPELDSITISSNRNLIGDQDHFRLLNSSRIPLRLLEYGLYGMTPQAYELTRTRHFATLQNIDLTICEGSTSSWTIEVLTLCPSLENFKAKSITAQEILETGPFVSLGLQELTLFIDMGFINNAPARRFTDEELEICKEVFRRLAIFKHLRVLDMLTPFKYAYAQSSVPHNDPRHLRFSLVPLPLRLEAGLGELHQLVKLTKVSFWGGRRAVYMNDLIWITNHWRRLRCLAGGSLVLIGTSSAVQDNYLRTGKLRTWLNKHNISTDGSRYEYHTESNLYDGYCEGNDREDFGLSDFDDLLVKKLCELCGLK
ncbi:hypothetical protein BGX27_009387 [Mortierella sp. AM989]|nr:hypothetical protein BGX27_009387 [Mortierella sp. AM989]